MVTVDTHSRTDGEGMLKLQINTGLANEEVDVSVSVRPAVSCSRGNDDASVWDRVYGSIEDPSFERLAQGAYERRALFNPFRVV